MIREDYLIFLQNEEWYYYDEEEGIYKLTDKATEEAIKSYKEFYENIAKEKNK